MATYLYCLLPAGTEPSGRLRSWGGSPVRAIEAAGLAAWVATVDARPAISPDALRAHDAVTNAALETGLTPLPLRFGETFDSDDECRASVAVHAGRFTAALRRVAGRVEMTVTIPLEHIDAAEQDPIETSTSAPGRAYLERLRHARTGSQIIRQQGHVLARPVANAVRDLVVDERSALRASPPTYLVSHLIARESVDEYRRRLAAVIGERRPGSASRAAVRGPSAPYSFVAEAG